jgi:hypothetical protein
MENALANHWSFKTIFDTFFKTTTKTTSDRQQISRWIQLAAACERRDIVAFLCTLDRSGTEFQHLCQMSVQTAQFVVMDGVSVILENVLQKITNSNPNTPSLSFSALLFDEMVMTELAIFFKHVFCCDLEIIKIAFSSLQKLKCFTDEKWLERLCLYEIVPSERRTLVFPFLHDNFRLPMAHEIQSLVMDECRAFSSSSPVSNKNSSTNSSTTSTLTTTTTTREEEYTLKHLQTLVDFYMADYANEIVQIVAYHCLSENGNSVLKNMLCTLFQQAKLSNETWIVIIRLADERFCVQHVTRPSDQKSDIQHQQTSSHNHYLPTLDQLVTNHPSDSRLSVLRWLKMCAPSFLYREQQRRCKTNTLFPFLK